MRRCAWAVIVGLAGCGGGGAGVADAAAPDTPAAITDGTFVLDRLVLPVQPSDAATYGVDLDGDGLRDDAFGLSVAVVASVSGHGTIPLQTMEDDAVAQGAVIDLVRLAGGAAITTYDGDHPSPAPCVDPQQPTPSTCGRHLQGTASFDVRAGSPTDASIAGAIAGGRFTGGPGKALVVISLFDSAPIELELSGARAAIDVRADGLGPGVIGGGIPASELASRVLPAIAAGMTARIASECGGGPPSCGCAAGTRGAIYAASFDRAPADCAITADEIAQSDLLKTLLAPDVIIDGEPCLSFGVGLTGVRAAF